jgi:SAM-dependent methyltransferase
MTPSSEHAAQGNTVLPADPYKRIAPVYDLVAAAYLRGMHERMAELCAQYGARRVLDVGCGTGLLTSCLSRSFAQVVGMDISRAMLGRAQEKRSAARPFSLVRGSALAPPFAGSAFDAVTYSLMLHEVSGKQAERMLDAGFSLAPRAFVLEWRSPERNLDYLLTAWSHGVEFLAGLEHYRGFREFMRRGGIYGLARRAGATVKEAVPLRMGSFILAVLER